MESLSSFFRL
ncbi:7341021a-1354-4937-a8df-27d3b4163105 [Thermothielavioides terrestris]|uniref:7341021a-1354-4937-a8df-27d3b4163105 n=1 Tax=Thermothielavioides terrestris TaxID=2587410 RepID=A0A446BM72_9PEZI|nr:7341021a-1354-4937-a8df-27d3b4163105 [Thermothielavioides terrestris]